MAKRKRTQKSGGGFGGSAAGRADALLRNLPPDAAASERADAARRALEISNESVSAWLILRTTESTPEAALFFTAYAPRDRGAYKAERQRSLPT